ncbi:MAG: RNA-splicing ligase RtcB [Betaproteobacteria bacterium RIFCSPLOWO2_02_FULL_63_19]|nr:MAG: RNA-splicing ligase RtcB [Betaproteobacteria bacterium RIFCSPLOWO2_02_FULL_63_19]
MQINTDKPYRIFADVLEQEALNQFASAMQQPFAVRGALMPDAHAGYSLPIGGVVATDGVVLPAWVGYDIGCGMCALPTSHKAEDVRAKARKIFDGIYKAVPVGFSHNARNTEWSEGDSLPRTNKMQEIFAKNGHRQLGSLGGGNHFAEVGADETGKVWIIIHSGSRGIGHAAASHYMRLASGDGKAREGHFGFAVESMEGADYTKDMVFCLAFALENRLEMMRRIVAVMDALLPGTADWGALINSNHNHAEQKDGLWIHRKGATHAEAGMMGVIPGNMRDGSFIVRGKANADALWSSSHGAGRVLGRKEAKRTLTMESFAETMAGVVARVTDETLDESPFAYKSIFEVMRRQNEMVEVVAHVLPILNIKG